MRANSVRIFGFVTGRSKTWKKEELRPTVTQVFLSLHIPPQISCSILSWTSTTTPLSHLPPHTHKPTLSTPPPTTTTISTTHNHHPMAGSSDELEYLKSLVAQLNEKIHALEQKAKAAVAPKTPAQQLRTILIGPPGAGTLSYPSDASHTLIRRVILHRKGNTGS